MSRKLIIPSFIVTLIYSCVAFGQPTPSSADLNGDGKIDIQDLFLFQKKWHAQTIETEFTLPSFSDFYIEPSVDVVPSVTPYSLPLDIKDIINWDHVGGYYDLDRVKDLIEANGFGVIASTTGEDMISLYEKIKWIQIPLFVTSDSLLHLYHVQFDESLKEIEERELFNSILLLTQALLADAEEQSGHYEGNLAEAAYRNVVYFSVALKLLDPEAEIPSLVLNEVNQELDLIEDHAGFYPSPIFVYQEDYSQYVPRGHYTRSEQLKKYFKAMMWYGRIGFLLRDFYPDFPPPNAEIQTLGACLIVEALENVEVENQKASDIWGRIYEVTAFYVGLADDLTPDEYSEAIQSVLNSAGEIADLSDPDTFQALRAFLANLRNPEIYGGTGNCYIIPPFSPEQIDECLDKSKGMRFMGQRFIPDSYIFQNLVAFEYTGTSYPFTRVESFGGPIRGFPRGLDAMDILGSTRAYNILAAEGDIEYATYEEERQKLIAEFSTFTIQDWNRNLYWSWLYSLKALLSPYGSGYPTFMQTEAWTDKNLNTALASWTQLRHDTILYAKPSTTPYRSSVPRDIYGYIEPVPEFYARLLALSEMTSQGLTELEVLSATAQERLNRFQAILEKLLALSLKELNGVTLSSEEYRYIQDIAIVLQESLSEVDEDGFKTTLIADVHTDANTSKVLEEGVGYVDLVAVVIPQPDGTLELALGPVFSYYEFKWPMSNRLTDEAWRDLLANTPPERPPWTESFLK